MKKEERSKFDNIIVGQVEEICFSISAEMVANFAHLTGDQSSLHTNSNFSRRSIYREMVVHGMLPIMFLSNLKIVQKNDKYGSLKKISAIFIKPVFVGDFLRLTAEVISVDEISRCAELFFKIFKSPSKIQVTTGVLILDYSQDNTTNDTNYTKNQNFSPIIQDTIFENDLKISNINLGDKEGFRFQILPVHINQLNKIILSGLKLINPQFLSIISLSCDPKRLLAVSILSTFVGMCRPGRMATFLDFSIYFKNGISFGKIYELESVVKYISQSTQTLVESVLIKISNEKIGEGKMKIKVNDSPRTMPSLIELREKGLNFQLKDKVVLVTGSSRGIGETIAKLFSLYGSKVAVNYLIGMDDANSVISEILDGGGVAKAFQGDVANRDQVNHMVKAIQHEFGNIDILINNAVRNAIAFNFLDLTWTEIQRDIDVTLKGAFNCCQAVIPGMISAGGGKIVNINTLFTENPSLGQFKYIVSKSCLTGLTRSLAVEMAQHNIQVNMVIPSMVETDLSAGIPKLMSLEIKNEIPMKRFSTALDVARAVIFLASSQASYTTGQKVMVTGGLPPYL